MTNIINLKDHRPGAKSETSSATKTQPGLGVSPEDSESLESRINARRAALIARLIEVRANAHLDVVDAGDKVKARLSELSHIMREGVVDGWTNLGDNVKKRLDRWLAESAQHLTAPAKSEQS